MKPKISNTQFEIMFPDPPVKIIHSKPAERSRDSEGRFCSELDLPTSKQEFKEIEEKRLKSLSNILRMKDEEILRLKEELKKYKN